MSTHRRPNTDNPNNTANYFSHGELEYHRHSEDRLCYALFNEAVTL